MTQIECGKTVWVTEIMMMLAVQHSIYWVAENSSIVSIAETKDGPIVLAAYSLLVRLFFPFFDYVLKKYKCIFVII